MKVELTFNNVWDGQKMPTAVIEFDIDEHIAAELANASEGKAGWDLLQAEQWKLKDILSDDMSVSII